MKENKDEKEKKEEKRGKENPTKPLNLRASCLRPFCGSSRELVRNPLSRHRISFIRDTFAFLPNHRPIVRYYGIPSDAGYSRKIKMQRCNRDKSIALPETEKVARY